MKIKIELDGLTLDQATELTKFLTSLKPLPEEIEQKTFSLKENDEVVLDKPKAARRKAEKIEVPAETSKEEALPETPQEETKPEEIEVTEPETISAPTLMQIRSLVAQKAAEHKDAIKAKLVELGAQNVSTLDAKHFNTIFSFLNEL